jgi:hypothetical protein
MKEIVAAYNASGLTIASKSDENILRDEFIKELISLVHQRKHWMTEKYKHQMWVHKLFPELELFCSQYANRSLIDTCNRLLAIEHKFSQILPDPTGKHSNRYDRFQFIIKISKAYVQARNSSIPGKC